MPWVDEIVCLECGKSIEITNGQLPPNACVPEPGDPQPEGPCALVMAKVWEPEMVAGTALFGQAPGGQGGQGGGPFGRPA